MSHYPTVADANAQTNPLRGIEYGYDLSGNVLSVADSAIAGTPASPGVVYEALSPDPGDLAPIQWTVSRS